MPGIRRFRPCRCAIVDEPDPRFDKKYSQSRRKNTSCNSSSATGADATRGNQFKIALHSLLRDIATVEHMTVFLLDDLQWANPELLDYEYLI
jgi:hypothetical protein